MSINWKGVIAAANLAALSMGGLAACSKKSEQTEEPAAGDTTTGGCAMPAGDGTTTEGTDATGTGAAEGGCGGI